MDKFQYLAVFAIKIAVYCYFKAKLFLSFLPKIYIYTHIYKFHRSTKERLFFSYCLMSFIPDKPG